LNPPGISLGRETDNDINLLIGGVSRYHSKLTFNKGSWVVEDLGSTNGTKVNGEKIGEPYVLKEGDLIVMGDQELRFGEGAAPEELKTFQDSQTPQVSDTVVEPVESEDKLEEEQPAAIINPMPDPIIKSPEPIFQPLPEPISGADNPLVTPASQTIPDAANPEAGGAAKSFFEQLKTNNGPSVPNPEEPKTDENLFSKMNFFGSDNKNDGNNKRAEDGGKSKKKHANLLFYVLVIGLAVIFVSIFIITEKAPKKQKGQAGIAKISQKAPFFLSYRKQITTPDNIFSFTLDIENGAAVFTLDDLKNQMHYKAIRKLTPETLDTLEREIKNTNFMTLTPEMPVVSEDGTDNERTLIIGQDNNLNKITVKNTYAKSSFEQIEAAIDDFAERYNLKTIALTPEERRTEADKAFYKAEQLFDNYEAKPENLREAVARYKIVLDMLDTFSPKPQKWDIARKKRQEAQLILDARIKELKFDYKRFRSLGENEKARDVCAKLIEMASPDSRDYADYKKYKIALDKYLRSKDRK
jgi:pSer/pThr/pTyr-binding forkhead associated (FHA) protein